MYERIPFDPRHPSIMAAQPGPRDAQREEAELYAEVARHGPCHSAVRDGRLICSAGLTRMWPGRYIAWMVTSAQATARDMGFALRDIRRFLDDAQADPQYQRIEATVDAAFAAGRRWVKRLGFVCEGVMEAFDANGRDCILFARVRRTE